MGAEQRTIRELEADLANTKESLQAVIEELQSTNAGLETSRAELQSVSQELETVNTELKQAEETLVRQAGELRQSNAELTAMFEAFSDLSFRVDADDTIRDCRAGEGAPDLYVPASEFLGKRMVDVLPEPVGTQYREAIRELHETRSPIGFEYTLMIGGEQKRFEARLSPLTEDQYLIIVRNITGRWRAETLQAGQNRVLELLADGADLGEALSELVRTIEQQVPGMLGSILLVDPTGAVLCHGAAPSLPREYVAAIDRVPIGPAVGSCGTAAYRGQLVISEDVRTDPLWVDYRDAAVEHDLRACWSQPIRSSGGGVLGTFALYYRSPRRPNSRELDLIEKAANLARIAIERERSDEARQLIVRELDHRVRNTLATVQSVAEQTLRSSAPLEEIREAFRGRIAALARIHGSLAEHRWEAVGLRELVGLTVAPFRRDGEGISIEGEAVTVPSEWARPIGMALHELATNAAKFGALSTGDGKVEVAWRVEPRPEGRRLRMTWTESGGPPAAEPSRRGFGTVLIQRSTPYELGGEARLEFPVRGVQCEFLIPFSAPEDRR